MLANILGITKQGIRGLEIRADFRDYKSGQEGLQKGVA